MSNEKNKINDEEILKFLKFSYFGDLNISIEVASNRAYRDMCRTIKFKKLKELTSRRELRDKVNYIFKDEISKLISGGIAGKNGFNKWHRNVCENIKKLYSDKCIDFTFGQAQKWINMTIKYLYMFQVYSFNSVFEYLHIPLDNYIFDSVEGELEIDRPNNTWSGWDNYDKYLKYQNDIREKICTAPLDWEFENWLDVAQNKN